ncbi:MAG: hypothetical protein A3A96_03295 [Candidatus Zambryskibacteria bacterium RIFCSPLOWO2_01_FULL_39_39]|uniref:Histidine kinase/HSP90-like ATPase domain-containing protein n=1 Tax=Candidatus Zambryskibacteria bacterium RIFCSPLOWO2_01_FULL_39_39 TaxID=1802758 RepID=A0A1G2TWJ8_9BACT|nr:MAG: hypothetical protein A2644_02685 [Candidatus Zambryskibacteria bacterium RIFCSPHIGHO2_01_FULL_39_63]OHA94384.1 MAG: hypothetical protein A3B88_01630 [Candidatus Zambryskibacteria bacterium RIFCSPHIGHO2_02_FULL_39_19]OHA97922.1 MAG: hypothetical protein A3F20_00595 [Candidatus Zambryskibacteria bacterium RIFCSPHIGHO2_12_FULL_39_21]OHB01661.1 MAG: hypothetical protein A3A96_03295 [Candidatus Zambryskibacteria bacterium RIFCSPLOWO2_01_FULL_39_39]
MKIHLPHGAFLGNIDQFLAGFDPANSEKLDITAVDRWMWLHPMVLSMVASLALKIDSKKISCQKITARSGHYLERMGLFRFLGIESGMEIIEHDPSGRFVPLTQIKNSTELTKFITDMVPMLHLEPKQVDPIRYTISELVRNVIEHAEAKNGAMVCAQYFKKSNTIRIGIADTGIGIKKSLSRFHPTDYDLEAIKLALYPGITGTTSRGGGTEQNAGAGLFFIKSIAYTNRDFFVVYSGDGMYKLLKRKENDELMLRANPDLDRHSEKKNLPNWNGTAIGIDISLDSTGQFNALLDLIRGTYSKAVRERRKERYREPKFI